MLNIDSQITTDSEAVPGVKFIVKTMGKMDVAKRELGLIETRYRLGEIYDEITPIEAIEESVRTPEQRRKQQLLSREYNLLLSSEVKPAVIRAALLSIEGVSVAGARATAETLLTSGGATEDDAKRLANLIDEIYLACESASGLNGEQRKNSEPATIGSELAMAGASESIIAEPAGA